MSEHSTRLPGWRMPGPGLSRGWKHDMSEFDQLIGVWRKIMEPERLEGVTVNIELTEYEEICGSFGTNVFLSHGNSGNYCLALLNWPILLFRPGVSLRRLGSRGNGVLGMSTDPKVWHGFSHKPDRVTMFIGKIRFEATGVSGVLCLVQTQVFPLGAATFVTPGQPQCRGAQEGWLVAERTPEQLVVLGVLNQKNGRLWYNRFWFSAIYHEFGCIPIHYRAGWCTHKEVLVGAAWYNKHPRSMCTRSWQPSKLPFRRNCPECRTTQKSDVGTWWGHLGNALSQVYRRL